jgi:arylsulfatase A-like enzyme
MPTSKQPNLLFILTDEQRADNTVIVFTSDHGDMMGDHALLAKGVMYEPAVRVPLLLHVPWQMGRPIAGRFSQIDLLPTLLDLMQQPLPFHLSGRSRRAVLEGEEELDDVVVEWNPPWAPCKSPSEGFTEDQLRQVTHQTWRTLISREGWKTNVCADDQCELYDLNRDPHELRNLWHYAEYASRREDLLHRLRNWQRANDDGPAFL